MREQERKNILRSVPGVVLPALALLVALLLAAAGGITSVLHDRTASATTATLTAIGHNGLFEQSLLVPGHPEVRCVDVALTAGGGERAADLVLSADVSGALADDVHLSVDVTRTADCTGTSQRIYDGALSGLTPAVSTAGTTTADLSTGAAHLGYLLTATLEDRAVAGATASARLHWTAESSEIILTPSPTSTPPTPPTSTPATVEPVEPVEPAPPTSAPPTASPPTPGGSTTTPTRVPTMPTTTPSSTPPSNTPTTVVTSNPTSRPTSPVTSTSTATPTSPSTSAVTPTTNRATGPTTSPATTATAGPLPSSATSTGSRQSRGKPNPSASGRSTAEPSAGGVSEDDPYELHARLTTAARAALQHSGMPLLLLAALAMFLFFAGRLTSRRPASTLDRSRRLLVISVVRLGGLLLPTLWALLVPQWRDAVTGPLGVTALVLLGTATATPFTRRFTRIPAGLGPAVLWVTALADAAWLDAAFRCFGGFGGPVPWVVLLQALVLTVLISPRAGVAIAAWHLLVVFLVLEGDLAGVFGRRLLHVEGTTAASAAVVLVLLTLITAVITMVRSHRHAPVVGEVSP